jgi:signal transduction histidine kinase
MERCRLRAETEHGHRVREQVELKNAVLEERNRIARELHDSLTQSLYSLTLQAEAGRRTVGEGNVETTRDNFAQIGQVAQQALKEMRLLVYELRPLGLDQQGLISGLRQRLDSVEKRAGVNANMLVEGEEDLPAPVEEALYRIAQEALNNALKHSGATAVTLKVVFQPGTVELEVSDNGRGFDPTVAGRSGGLGLVGMRERAGHLHGSLTIDSEPAKGTTIRVLVNLQ